MISTGSLIINSLEDYENLDSYKYSYKLIFNKHINYCQEIAESFSTINEGLASNWIMKEDDDNLVISIFHDTSIATKETDLFFIFLTSLYYDCEVRGKSEYKDSYAVRMIDGKLKPIPD